MLWDIIDKGKFSVYINRDIDLKVKICEASNKIEVHMNYKGYNVTIPMLVWEFSEDLKFADISNVRMEGDDMNKKYFVIDKNDVDKFLNEVYFFLIDNNMDSVLRDEYRVEWE